MAEALRIAPEVPPVMLRPADFLICEIAGLDATGGCFRAIRGGGSWGKLIAEGA